MLVSSNQIAYIFFVLMINYDVRVGARNCLTSMCKKLHTFDQNQH